MTISFNQIPANTAVPGTYIEFDGTGARSATGARKYTNVVMGQMRSSGATAIANMPYLVTSKTQAETLFGVDSILAHMAGNHFKENSLNETYFVGQLDDGAGVARVLTVNYATPYAVAATVAGVESLYIGESEYRIAVAVGNTSTIIATAMAAAINADTRSLFTATSSTSTLTLTAKAKGELMNDVVIVSQYYSTDTTAGTTFVTPTQTVAGATNPSVANALANIANLDFTHLTVPYNDDANALLINAEALDRWAAIPSSTSLGAGQRPFMTFGAVRGTEAQLITHFSDRNSAYRTSLCLEPSVTQSSVLFAGLLSSPFQAAAAYAAASSKLTSIVPNKPHQNVVLTSLKAAAQVAKFPWSTRNRLIALGGSTYTYTGDNQVLLENGITERITTDNGTPSDAEIRVETQFAKDYIQWSLKVMMENTYPSHRLADDGTAGLPSDVATPNLIKGSLISLAKSTWVPMGLVENLANFKNTLIVQRSAQDCNRIEFQMFPDLVNILVVKAGKVSYIIC